MSRLYSVTVKLETKGTEDEVLNSVCEALKDIKLLDVNSVEVGEIYYTERHYMEEGRVGSSTIHTFRPRPELPENKT